MYASPQITRSKTSILDLNDDCLKGVFAHMEPEQLTIVADVCTRFKENTMHSARTKCKKMKLFDGIPSVLVCSKLRNFGQFMETIEVSGRRNDVEYQLRIIELLSLYCVGESIKLTLNCFNITREVAVRMKPLRGRLYGLRFDECRFHELISKKLSLWSTQLCELIYTGCNLSSIGDRQKAVVLRQKFPKLVLFSFDSLTDVQISDFEKFLQQNPQLKEIDVSGRLLCSGDTIFQSIAKYVPTVEKLLFNGRVTDPRTAKYVGRLRDLKSLYFGTSVDTRFIQSVVREIASTNIALELLDVNLSDETVQFIEGVSKLQTLKTLHLTFGEDLSEAQIMDFRKHLIEMSKHLKDLSKLWLFGKELKITEDDLLELVQNAEKLQKFEYLTRYTSTDLINISEDTIKKLSGIVERRPERTPLTLRLPSGEYTDNNINNTDDMPMELTSVQCGTSTLMIERWRVLPADCDECAFKGYPGCYCS